MFSDFVNSHVYFAVLLTLVTSDDGDPVTTADKPCIPRDFGRGSIVCVCNSTYCDTTQVKIDLTSESRKNTGNASESSGIGLPVQVWTSTKSGSRLHKSIVYFNTDENEKVYGSQHFLSPTDKHHLRNREPPTQRRFKWFTRFTERRGERFLPFFNARMSAPRFPILPEMHMTFM